MIFFNMIFVLFCIAEKRIIKPVKLGVLELLKVTSSSFFIESCCTTREFYYYNS